MFHPQPTPYAHALYSYGYGDGVNEYPSAAAGCYPPGSESIGVSVQAPPGLQQQQGGLGVAFGLGGGVGVGGTRRGGGGIRGGAGHSHSHSHSGPGPAPTPAPAWADTRNPRAAVAAISGAPQASQSRAAPSVVPAVAPHHHNHHQPQHVFYSQQQSFRPIPVPSSLKTEPKHAGRRSSNHKSSKHNRHAPVYPQNISIAHDRSSAFQPQALTMDPNQPWPTPQQTSDMEAQEAAARTYVQEYEGPPVGDKISSLSITEDYAKGNPIYVAKTTALPQTYSHYRPIRGDGNCGWRAIGFAYFESLVLSGDLNRLRAEHDRVRQLNSYIAQVGGYDETIWEDMAHETFSTFEELGQTMGMGLNIDLAMNMLREKFSTQETSDGMMYHLRLMAASWMKGHPDDFAGFIEDGRGVDAYCASKIEIPGEQIEHLSITALFKVLLQPAGIPMQIAYLDTSPGSHVNSHLYQVDEMSQQMTPEQDSRTVFLLYRPGHYDILYRHTPPPAEVQVNLVSGFDDRHGYSNNLNLQNFSELDMTPLAFVPGLSDSYPSMGPGPLSPVGVPSPMDEYVPSPPSPWLARPVYSETGSPIQHEAYQAEEQSSSSASSSTLDTNHPLRFSRWQYQQMMEESPTAPPSIPEDDLPDQQPAFKTRLFKNSHYNTAHYNNPHFHPEEYDPAAEECPYYARSSTKKKTKIPLRLASDME